MNEGLISPDEPTNRRLLVEGADDSHFCYQLLSHYGLKKYIDIVDKKGIDKLLQSIPTELLGSQLEYLGILVDADSNLSTRWQSIRDILLKSGYQTLPLSPQAGGTIIIEADKPHVGCWLMPDNQLPGIIEDFCRCLIPPDDCLWAITEETIQRVIQLDRRFPENQKMKAQLHTWLAWQHEPGKPLGQAITKRYLKPDANHAQLFIAWIKTLYNLSTYS